MTEIEENSPDRHIDQIIKTKWHAIGLTQADIAEVLNCGLARIQENKARRPRKANADLMRVAKALDVPSDGTAHGVRQQRPGLPSIEPLGAMQALLTLRMNRAFHALTDQRAKEVLVRLAEQIVKREHNRR
jgi:hypothetical protein